MNNQGVWNGQRFWSGLVHLATGVIVAVYTYEQAEAADFHISHLLPEALDAEYGDEILGYFWINDGVISGEMGDHEDLTEATIRRIAEQIEIRS